MVKRLFSRIFTFNPLYEIGSHDAGATAAFVVVHVISTTFKFPTPSSNHTVTHRSFSIVLTHLPVNIGWLDFLGLWQGRPLSMGQPGQSEQLAPPPPIHKNKWHQSLFVFRQMQNT
jgi:hypothetical protein